MLNDGIGRTTLLSQSGAPQGMVEKAHTKWEQMYWWKRGGLDWVKRARVTAVSEKGLAKAYSVKRNKVG